MSFQPVHVYAPDFAALVHGVVPQLTATCCPAARLTSDPEGEGDPQFNGADATISTSSPLERWKEASSVHESVLVAVQVRTAPLSVPVTLFPLPSFSGKYA